MVIKSRYTCSLDDVCKLERIAQQYCIINAQLQFVYPHTVQEHLEIDRVGLYLNTNKKVIDFAQLQFIILILCNTTLKFVQFTLNLEQKVITLHLYTFCEHQS